MQWPGGLKHPGAEPQAGLPTWVHPNAWHCPYRSNAAPRTHGQLCFHLTQWEPPKGPGITTVSSIGASEGLRPTALLYPIGSRYPRHSKELLLLAGNCLPYHQPEFLATKETEKALGPFGFFLLGTWIPLAFVENSLATWEVGSLVGFFSVLESELFPGSLENTLAHWIRDLWVLFVGIWILLTFVENSLGFLRSGFSGWNFKRFWRWVISWFTVVPGILFFHCVFGTSLTGSCFLIRFNFVSISKLLSLLSGSFLGKCTGLFTPRWVEPRTLTGRKQGLRPLPHATLRYISQVLWCIRRRVVEWTGRCCHYPLRDTQCSGLGRETAIPSCVQTTVSLPFFRVWFLFNTAWSLVRVVLWPGCTWSRSSSRTCTVG